MLRNMIFSVLAQQIAAWTPQSSAGSVLGSQDFVIVTNNYKPQVETRSITYAFMYAPVLTYDITLTRLDSFTLTLGRSLVTLQCTDTQTWCTEGSM